MITFNFTMPRPVAVVEMSPDVSPEAPGEVLTVLRQQLPAFHPHLHLPGVFIKGQWMFAEVTRAFK